MPTPGAFVLWLLTNIEAWRYDCHPPPLPNDLVMMTRMNRQYRDNTTGEMRSKERNVYFHLNVHYIRRKQPYFSPQIATLSDETAPYLTQAHLHFLRAFGLNLPFLKRVVRYLT